MTLATDMSSWGGPITPAKVETLWQAGARRNIVGVSNVALARQQLALTSQRGMEIQAYSYMYFEDGDNRERIRNALLAAEGLPLTRLWLDFEDQDAPLPAHGYDASAVVFWISNCLAVARGFGVPIGIYTAAWWWRPWTRDSTVFAREMLWAAQYDEWPVLTITPFGGWGPECAMKQHTGTTVLGEGESSYSVDLNFYGEETMPEVIDEKARRDAAQATFRQHIAGEILTGDPALADKAYWELQYVRLLAGLPILQPSK